MNDEFNCDNVMLVGVMKSTINMIRQTLVSIGYPVKLEGKLNEVSMSINEIELLLSSLSFAQDGLEYLEAKLKKEA